MAKNKEIQKIIDCLNILKSFIGGTKSPEAVQKQIFTYVSPFNTSLKKLYGFAPPPLRLDKLEANASSVESLIGYVNKYFNRWPDTFTETVDDTIAIKSQNFNSAKTAKTFVYDTLVPQIMSLLQAPQSGAVEQKLKALQETIKNYIDVFNAIIVKASEKFKTLANDRKKGTALYYLKETKKTGTDSKPPKDTKKTKKTEKDSNTPENTIKAFKNFLNALAKEFRKDTELNSKIKTLQTTLKNIKI